MTLKLLYPQGRCDCTNAILASVHAAVLLACRVEYDDCMHAGTHDNETAVGWWADSATDVDRAFLKKYSGSGGDDIAWLFIRAAFASVSRTSIVLMQARQNGGKRDIPLDDACKRARTIPYNGACSCAASCVRRNPFHCRQC